MGDSFVKRAGFDDNEVKDEVGWGRDGGRGTGYLAESDLEIQVPGQSERRDKKQTRGDASSMELPLSPSDTYTQPHAHNLSLSLFLSLSLLIRSLSSFIPPVSPTPF